MKTHFLALSLLFLSAVVASSSDELVSFFIDRKNGAPMWNEVYLFDRAMQSFNTFFKLICTPDAPVEELFLKALILEGAKWEEDIQKSWSWVAKELESRMSSDALLKLL